MTVSAATATWDAPTAPVKVDDSIVKVGAHAAATSAVHFLGGNLVTERFSDFRTITGAADAAASLQAGQERLELGVFGTAVNDNPDPYLWNYLYNLYADANGLDQAPTIDTVYLSSVMNPAGYSAADVEAMIAEGLQYYVDHSAEVAAEAEKLVPSDRLTLPEPTPEQPTVKAKKTNTLTVKAMNKTYKVKKLKKAKQTYTALKVSKAKGTVTYKATYANAKSKKALKVSKGKVTVKKGTKKGTYKVKVKVTAKGNSSYKAKSITKTITVKVK